MSTTDRRTYVVGLPVIITINPDDVVTIEVDTGDLSKVLGDHSDYPQAVVTNDAMRLHRWTQTHAVSNEGFLP